MLQAALRLQVRQRLRTIAASSLRRLSTDAGADSQVDAVLQNFESLVPGVREALRKPRSNTPLATPESILDSMSKSPASHPMLIPPSQDPLLHYIASLLTHHGERSKAQRRVSRILLYIHAYTRARPLPILRQAVMAAAPAVRNITYRTPAGKVTIRPVALNEKQRIRFAVANLLKACNRFERISEGKIGKTIEERFARECILVLQQMKEPEGSVSVFALKEKYKMHRTAATNRALVVQSRRR